MVEEDFAKGKAMVLQVERTSDRNPNTDEVMEWKQDWTKNTVSMLVSCTMRHADVTRSGKNFCFNVKNLTSSLRYRVGNPECERKESLRFELGHEPCSVDQWSSAGIERQGSI